MLQFNCEASGGGTPVSVVLCRIASGPSLQAATAKRLATPLLPAGALGYAFSMVGRMVVFGDA